ncbi:ArsR/SmtB family transcription factor [Phreatobacter sp.]|uniref:ArsR/SmtB family transcription factor n=1 Tax=Phreatobacter sp. TaxID=1966341 RepID=UPI003F700E31
MPNLFSSAPAAHAFDDAVAVLRAVGEPTRLRLIALVAETELTVTDMVDILGQSQPRISRHLKLLLEAGLVERVKEGSWAFFRAAGEGAGGLAVTTLVALVDPADPILAIDRERLAEVRAKRAAEAQAFFGRHAADWDRLRALHVPEERVEAAVREALTGRPVRALLDLGTGTGRMLELFAPEIERGLGIDASPEMLSLARAALDRAGIRHCSVRTGDIYALGLPRDAYDAVIIHQVLHFLDDGARAIREAARVLRPGGRLVVVDFAPHEQEFLREAQAHRRLGFGREVVEGWMEAAGLDLCRFQNLAPEGRGSGKLTVSIWVGRDPRIITDAPALPEAEAVEVA